jgi:hypothetical protein
MKSERKACGKAPSSKPKKSSKFKAQSPRKAQSSKEVPSYKLQSWLEHRLRFLAEACSSDVPPARMSGLDGMSLHRCLGLYILELFLSFEL